MYKIMKDETTIRNINGSWYLRIPPTYVRYLELEGETGTGYDARIQDEKSKHGKYCSFWKKGE